MSQAMRSDGVIRPAREADLDDVMTLYAEFHAFHVRGVLDRLRLLERPADLAQCEAERADVRERLWAILRDSAATLVVADAGGVIVGLAEVYLRRDEPHPLIVAYTYGYLQSLVVTGPWRGRGVGSQLVAAAEAWARERGAAQLRLETWEFAAGPAPFYETLGYRTAKRTLVKPLE